MTTNPVEDWLSRPGGLAARLRDTRKQAGLSGKALASAAGWAPSKVSRIENGIQVPSDADVDEWVRLCSADADTARDLVALLRGVQNARHDWRRRLRRGQSGVQADYNRLVAESGFIAHFETVYVPGLLQTADYIRRVLSEIVGLHRLDINDVENAVAVRMERQRFLYDQGKRFEFLLAEPVLRWMLCPPGQMRAQLDRLHTVIGMSNVRFGILPLGVRLETTPQNSFQIYGNLAIVETFVGETVHTDEEAVEYVKMLELLWAEAAEGDEARRLVMEAARCLPEE